MVIFMKKNKVIHKDAILIALVDVLLVIASLYIATSLRFDLIIPRIFKVQLLYTLPISVSVIIVLNIAFGLYNIVWKYASIDVVLQVFLSSIIGSAITFFITKLLSLYFKHLFIESRSIYLIFALINVLFLGGFRIILRLIGTGTFKKSFNKNDNKRIMVIGAGWAGASTIRDIKSGRHGNSTVVVAVDNDETRIGTVIHGVPVVGDTSKVSYWAKKYSIDEIIVAIATPKGKIGDLISSCLDTGCNVRRVANIVDINSNAGKTLSVFKDIDLNDLLGRAEENIDLEPVKQFFKGKNILITGGGGSIGSELCRQIMNFDVKNIILFDISENYIYDLKSELIIKYGDKAKNIIKLCIGSVRDKDRLEEVFDEFRPNIVLHAAAHKHVPLMEDCPRQAVLNNVFGTYYTALVSKKYNVSNFVLLSTDKAVNPTNIMGATKRLCEMIVQGLIENDSTKFAIVRFGNVLGSHGSVVPLFERQIRAGGPVTVTDPNVIRFFMSIQEASKLVLKAASMSTGGEIYVLDMGEPVKILDLAERMVKLYSDPYKNPVEIKIIGMRKGEKIKEEVLSQDENAHHTNISKILVTKSDEINYKKTCEIIEKLEITIQNNLDMRECLKSLVPTFISPEAANKSFSKKELSEYRRYE